jgi:hypothetical protein
MAFIKALIVNFAVSAVWMASEYAQFGELQYGRECDNIVFWLYLCITWCLFLKIGD